jgi:phosphoserine phosphatase
MTAPARPLPSWNDGPVRDAVMRFLEASADLPISERVAAFDNDGTLWCERPSYVQLDFLVDVLRQRVSTDPSLAERAEFAALLESDEDAQAELGLVRIAVALAELLAGITPEEFTARSREFMGRARHPTLGIPLTHTVYQPMVELLQELRQRDFTTFIVTGGGTEFVRAISHELYGVPPECVVGTLVEYEFSRDETGRPRLLRGAGMQGRANEGEAKVAHIQAHLGRRPILGVGNSGGDQEMMEWACIGDEPFLALLVDHDDAEREFSYVSTAQTFAESEPIVSVAERLHWTVISMANDWSTVFPSGK